MWLIAPNLTATINRFIGPGTPLSGQGVVGRGRSCGVFPPW
jgi:hypothetical protein